MNKMENKENFLEYKLAKNLRRIIEDYWDKLVDIDISNPEPWFKDFPLWACCRSSALLLHYLNDFKIKNYKVICSNFYDKGKYWNWQHTFLESENYVIDITWDQFNGKIIWLKNDKVIFIEKEYYFIYNIDDNLSLYNDIADYMNPKLYGYLDFYNKYVKNSKL